MQKLLEVCGEALLGIGLFGSRARGDFRSNSDRDLLIALGREIPIERSLYRRWDEALAPYFAERDSPHFAHLPDLDRGAGSLWLECARDATILWEKNRSLSNIFERLRHEIALGRYQRKLSHGHPYWITDAKGAP